jgi:elongation factor 3
MSSQTNFSDDFFENKKLSVNDKLIILDSLEKCTDDEIKLKMITHLIDMSNDKNQTLQIKGKTLLKNYISTINPFLIKSVSSKLLYGLDNKHSIKLKIYILELLNELSDTHKYFTQAIINLVEPISYLLSEITESIANLSKTLYSKMLLMINNKDILPLKDFLIDGLSNPTQLASTIDKITSTTFVQTVDDKTLSIVVPILTRTFNKSTYAIQRQTIIIIENMTKLVVDEKTAYDFIIKLLPLLEDSSENIPDPDIRKVAQRVLAHLLNIKIKGLEQIKEQEEHINKIKSILLNFKKTDEEILNMLIETNNLTEDNLMKYVNLTPEQSLKTYNELTSKTMTKEEEINAEELCNIEFTLGYGSRVLLHQTKLHLYRGYKYGLIGPNNSGKTTLMKSMASQQLESFPSDLKSVFVETDILGELSHLSLIEYIKQDKRLEKLNLSENIINDTLQKLGFTEDMMKGGVSSLSGGWRMKLALARAMMQDADILLMDEPSAHLDVINVKWLLDYIKNLKNVTCIIVSQNAKLLDMCCTHIIQIKNLKLYTTKGNLTEFIKKNPEAQSYFELKSDKYAFKFPQPRFLQGIKSKGKALMKMENVTFTYPGNKSPTIKNASVQVSLSSRIGCLGPNGAGKSTTVKILTGQLQPDSGTVWTYQGMKFGYIAQHAFAHIEKHLEKTPNEYIRWRYNGGEDKEDLQKVTMIMTEEEEKLLDKNIIIEVDGKNVKKQINRLTGSRRNGHIEREYEVELEGMSYDYNQWVRYSDLAKKKYEKILKVIDIKCDAAENSYQVALTLQNVEEHLEKVGLDRETASHVKIKHLSNGDKVKVVVGAALWMAPHILILDEPTNNIDRDGLAALSEAIKEFEGGIIIITHDEQFCNSVCKEIWTIENGLLNIKGDPDWMKNILGEKIEEKKQEDEMTDANGNVIKLKVVKNNLSRKEKMALEKRKKTMRELGYDVSNEDDD